MKAIDRNDARTADLFERTIGLTVAFGILSLAADIAVDGTAQPLLILVYVGALYLFLALLAQFAPGVVRVAAAILTPLFGSIVIGWLVSAGTTVWELLPLLGLITVLPIVFWRTLRNLGNASGQRLVDTGSEHTASFKTSVTRRTKRRAIRRKNAKGWIATRLRNAGWRG